MIFAELLAIVMGIGGLAVGVHVVDVWRKKSGDDAARLDKVKKQMQDDLRDALKSRDHRRLEDWLVLYADHVTPETKKHVQTRRDELYLEVNK